MVTGSRDYCATPEFAHEPSSEKLKKLSDDLLSMGQGVQFVELLKANEYVPSFFHETSITKYRNRTDVIICRPTINKVLQNIVKSDLSTTLIHENSEFISNHLLLTPEEIIRLESETIEQSSSERWFEERKKRITASKFGAIMNRRRNIFPKSIVQGIVANKIKFYSEACKWGLDNE